IDNLRILAASEKSTIEKSLTPAVQSKLGVYNEDLLEGLDFLLSEMNKRDMHAVIFLNNYWEWSGGMGQYNAWTSKSEAVDPGDFSNKWQEFNDYVSSFYSNEKANEYFKKFINEVITRKNKFTDKYYFEDPTIMAWQLANEPRPGNGEAAIKNIEFYYNWINETAEFIHSIDSNHLVTTGSEGVWGSLNSEAYFLKAHESPYIDYLTFHLWAKNWGWFKADDIEGTYASTEKNAINYINEHLQLAKELNKPITLEEFGLPRNFEYTLRGTLTSARDKYFKKIFEVIYDSAANGAAIAGTNFWTWGGDAFKKHDDSIWRKGDPFTGDPPQEPQGLNSIFNTDYNTLKIIKEHGSKMKLLREVNENTQKD
ncbi:MAG: mannanase, partial [Ignavibacteriae bacterium]|nr:mannanase [Ignavibacteriota bacterium]